MPSCASMRVTNLHNVGDNFDIYDKFTCFYSFF